jgi:hypothetical protein
MDRRDRARKPELAELLDPNFRRPEPQYLTMELLLDVLALTHPDKHPPERADVAKRVTAELLALKPFVAPKPKPKPAVVMPAPGRGKSAAELMAEIIAGEKGLCRCCFFTTPMFYCDACRKNYDERRKKKRALKLERDNARQRDRRKRRKLARQWKQRRPCPSCQKVFSPARADAKYCSAACRQRAHRNGSMTIAAGLLREAVTAPP